ncbi:hypothetical protein SAMN05428959_103362 [Duganella sp. CF517]|uniref:hypothetical protein n=1 Tax=Duganella sp. CF517 TaxID=1881038 RepID=UPI0008D2B974|nr:hypothetical protein [Duganella sp. CF517]SEN83784.1 hypothetical protein SAMN05428959_103362 [Duganella sp. CF517]
MTSPHSFWTWSPQFYFPWSGGVMQQIDPDLTWFSQWITPGAGNAAIEQKAFTGVASYGKQLGLITDVLLAIVDQAAPTAEPKAVEELRRIRSRIEMLKAVEYTLANDQIIAQVNKIRERGGAELHELSAQLLPLLTDTRQQQALRNLAG